MSFSQKISCINGGTKKMLLIIEPWAEEYWVEAGETVEVAGQSKIAGGHFEVEHSELGMTVYGWEGSIVSVFRGGEVVEPSSKV